MIATYQNVLLLSASMGVWNRTLAMSVSYKQVADFIPVLSMIMSSILCTPVPKFCRTEITPVRRGGDASKYTASEVKIFSRPAPFVMYRVK